MARDVKRKMRLVGIRYQVSGCCREVTEAEGGPSAASAGRGDLKGDFAGKRGWRIAKLSASMDS
jgi:hypothetical protein